MPRWPLISLLPFRLIVDPTDSSSNTAPICTKFVHMLGMSLTWCPLENSLHQPKDFWAAAPDFFFTSSDFCSNLTATFSIHGLKMNWIGKIYSQTIQEGVSRFRAALIVRRWRRSIYCEQNELILAMESKRCHIGTWTFIKGKSGGIGSHEIPQRKVEGIRYEALSRGRSSPDSWLFEPAKRPDDIADYCVGDERPRLRAL